MVQILMQSEFNDKVVLVRECLNRKEKRCLIRSISKAFNDKNGNFNKWLHGEPCVFTHPKTGNRIEIRIGDDCEAIYNFLIYCCKLNDGDIIDGNDFDYLAYLISRSVYGTEVC